VVDKTTGHTSVSTPPTATPPPKRGRDAPLGNGASKVRLPDRIRRLFLGAEGSDIVRPAPQVPIREIFRYFWPYARPYRLYVAISIVFILLVPAVVGARLYMGKLVIDGVLVPADLTPLLWIVPISAGLTLAALALGFCQGYLSTWIGERFLLSLRTNFFRHLQGLSMDFFERRRLGDILARVTGDTAAIESFVLSGVADALSSVVKIVLFAGALFYLDWRLALVTLFFAPAVALLARSFSRLIKRATREKRRRAGAYTAIAEESLANIPLVQAYNRQELETERFHREGLGAFAATMVMTRAKLFFAPLVELAQSVSTMGVVVLGTLALADGRMSLGGLYLFLAYVSQLYAPVRSLAALYNSIAGVSASADRVIEFFKEQPTVIDREHAHQLSRARGLIEYNGVSFRYPGTTRDALADISLQVQPGETVALVGHSGAGKTTMVKLLLRFYDPTVGGIHLDDRDLRDLQVKSLRDNIAVLLQETLIVDGTIRDNILYGRPDASEQDVLEAAVAADAHQFISSLPDGYETVVGEKGRRLSGGQRQRVAIARAMIRDAPVLVLDEPTTSLDAESGHRILEPLRRLMRQRTTMIISHNLATVREVDRIIVLDEGGLAEQGTHEELLARGDAYATLFRLTQDRLEQQRLQEASGGGR
jgi:ATP-binding cassette subfamily B protein